MMAPSGGESAEFQFVAACVCRPLNDDRQRQIRARSLAVTDWPLLLAIAVRQHVAALVYQACHQAGVAIPPETATRFAERAKAVTGETILLALESGRLQRAFADAGVAVIFLKGSTLAVLAYGEVGLRHAKDIDLLIEPARYEHAVACLRSAGYTARLPLTVAAAGAQAGLLREGRSVEWRHPAKNIELELHWKPTDMLLLTRMTSPPAVQQVAVLPGMFLPTLGPDELVTYLCVHGGGHAWSRLKWLADVYALLPSSRPQEIEAIYRRSTRRDHGRTFGQALLLCHEIFGLELPAAFLAELRRDWLQRLATFLAKTALTRGGGAVEIYDLPFGTTVVYLSRFLLGRSMPFLRNELRHVFQPPEPVTAADSRQRATFVAIFRRLSQWAADRRRHRGKSRSERPSERTG